MALGDKRYRTIDGMDMEFISQGTRTVDGQVRDIWRPAVDAGNNPSNGEPSIVAGRTAVVGVEVTRPADVLPYIAGDVVSNSTSAGVTINFATLARKTGGSGYITKARIITSQSTNIARFRLHLFRATPDPATVVNDNVARTSVYANKDKSIGSITFSALSAGGAGSDSAGDLNSDIRLAFAGSADANIYGVLETLDGFTPANGQKFYLELTAEQN